MDLKTEVKMYILAAITGILVGFGAVAFLGLINILTKVVWPHGVPGIGGGTWVIPVVLTTAGLLMGLCVKYFGTNDGLGFEAVLAASKKTDGEIRPIMLPRVVLNASIGLIAGASIGPEVPLIAVGGYLGSAFAQLLKLSKEQVRAVTGIAVGASLGVLLESPVAGPLAIVESENNLDRKSYLRIIFLIMLATGIGYAIFLRLVGPVLTNLAIVPTYSQFASIDMLYGFLIGIMAGVVGVVAQKSILGLIKFGKKWSHRPVLRATLLGLVIGLISMVAPLIMFAGDKELPQAVSHAATFGVLMLLGLCAAKVLVTGLAFSGGYQGGNIFPSFFIGGTLGLAISLVFPFVPVPVAMVACMAGIMFAMMPMPLMLIFILTVISTTKLMPVTALAMTGAAIVVMGSSLIKPSAPSTNQPALV